MSTHKESGTYYKLMGKNIKNYNPSNILLSCDWYKCIKWLNTPQLKLGNIQVIIPIFKTARVAKNIWRMINTIASICLENMLTYLSLDITRSSKLKVFLDLCSWKTVHFSEQFTSTQWIHPNKLTFLKNNFFLSQVFFSYLLC